MPAHCAAYGCRNRTQVTTSQKTQASLDLSLHNFELCRLKSVVIMSVCSEAVSAGAAGSGRTDRGQRDVVLAVVGGEGHSKVTHLVDDNDDDDDDDDDDDACACSEAVSAGPAGSGRSDGGQRDVVVAVAGARRRFTDHRLRHRDPGARCCRRRLDEGQTRRVQ